VAELKTGLVECAKAAGFDVVRVTRPDSIAPAEAFLRRYIAEGRHGDMTWLAEHAGRRASPLGLWPQTRSVIMLGMNYGPDKPPLAAPLETGNGVISVYARRKDYHGIIKKRLKQVARWLHGRTGAELKVFVDTAPVMEKPLAAAAGLGWQGKHTNLVSRDFGAWLFLGAIYTAADIAPDTGSPDHCGACRACLDACPTRAFPAPYQLDARRCISYLTIEHKGHIEAELRPLMGNRIFGCDDCLAVCPWNRFASAGREATLALRPQLEKLKLADLARLDDAAFRDMFAGTPVKRAGRDRFVRNVLVAIGNSGRPGLAKAARERLSDESPLVRAMAVWALARLLPAAEFTRLSERFSPAEDDDTVRLEWKNGQRCDQG
jgi:epoxyqueuosine reductase